MIFSYFSLDALLFNDFFDHDAVYSSDISTLLGFI